MTGVGIFEIIFGNARHVMADNIFIGTIAFAITLIVIEVCDDKLSVCHHHILAEK